MSIKAVLFDLDDTLFDHLASAKAGLQAFTRHLGLAPSNDLAGDWFTIERANYDRFLAKELTFQEQRRERLRQFLPLAGYAAPAGEEDLNELFAVYLECYERSWQAFPDAGPCLQALRDGGVLTAVISNGNHAQQQAKLRSIGLESALDAIFTSESIGHPKPMPEAFLKPCEALSVLPVHALYVGDNFRVDIEGARNAGLQAVHLQRGGTPERGTLQNLKELTLLMSATAVPRA
ncbi:HAD family hydrolase [Pseudarthrobacter equi]|uniref:HAD family hydrolase n=1 Tax=Pseudarthrobacter equi TaxID=728066 RepID=UPI0021C1886F|nr:HAD family hydrolase [Pseudarthrobacter equi]